MIIIQQRNRIKRPNFHFRIGLICSVFVYSKKQEKHLTDYYGVACSQQPTYKQFNIYRDMYNYNSWFTTS